jgi:hypothetical protein
LAPIDEMFEKSIQAERCEKRSARHCFGRRQEPAWHFFMKLVFAAPESFFPSLPTALAAQASVLHFLMKLVFAAPAKGFPSFPTA